MFWRRKGAVCWTVTDYWEKFYPVKVRIVGGRFWRYRAFDLIQLESLHDIPWYRLRRSLKAARAMARRMNERRIGL